MNGLCTLFLIGCEPSELAPLSEALYGASGMPAGKAGLFLSCGTGLAGGGDGHGDGGSDRKRIGWNERKGVAASSWISLRLFACRSMIGHPKLSALRYSQSS